MAKRGRPPKLTRRKQEEFCEMLDAGLSRSAAARAIGCVPSAISKALARDRAFRRKVERTERAAELVRLEKKLILAPYRNRRALERLRDFYRGILKPSAKKRDLAHRLELALYRFTAEQLRLSEK
jgi:IS30 family transposase